MEVHAHTHSPRKNFTHYLWEFLMLFLAVFCGFLAENIREHSVERHREKQFIHGLVEDLIEDSALLHGYSAELNANVSRLDSFINLLTGDKAKDHGSELYYLGRRASRGSWLALHDRTFQQLKNSGQFRLIRNGKVSNAIIEYYNRLTFIGRLETIEMDESQEYRKMAIDVFHPVIFNNIIAKDNSVMRPEENPALLTYDNHVLFRLTNMISYCKNSRLALAKAGGEMNVAAKELILLVKKEYRFE